MRTICFRIISVLMLAMFCMTAQAQEGFAVNDAFSRYGAQKGFKLVSLRDGKLKGYDLKIYKSLTFRKNAEEIAAMVKKDRAKAQKIKEVVADGVVTTGYYTLLERQKGTNCYLLFRRDAYGCGVLIYIEGVLSAEDIMRLTKK